MDEDIAEKEALLFLLLWRCRLGQRRKNNRKNPRFWFRDIFRQRNQYHIATSAGTEELR